MKDSQNQNQTKLELQMMESSLRSNSALSQGFDEEITAEETVYKQNSLEALSSKIDQCLNKQKELNFIAREVSQVLKKLK